MPKLYGSAPNQVPTNADLGRLAFQDHAFPVGPAFSAYQSSPQTLTGSTPTLLNFQTEEYDTNSCFDTTTGRFTPNVAGYYLVTGSFGISSTATPGLISFYKNGTEHKRCSYVSATSGINTIQGSALIYCNGTTDYITCIGFVTTGQALSASSVFTYFQGFLARAG